MTAMFASQPLSWQREPHWWQGLEGRGSCSVVESRHVAAVHRGLGARARPTAWPTTPNSPSSPVNGMASPPLGVHLRPMHVTCLV